MSDRGFLLNNYNAILLKHKHKTAHKVPQTHVQNMFAVPAGMQQQLLHTFCQPCCRGRERKSAGVFDVQTRNAAVREFDSPMRSSFN